MIFSLFIAVRTMPRKLRLTRKKCGEQKKKLHAPIFIEEHLSPTPADTLNPDPSLIPTIGPTCTTPDLDAHHNLDTLLNRITSADTCASERTPLSSIHDSVKLKLAADNCFWIDVTKDIRSSAISLVHLVPLPVVIRCH